MLPGVGSPHVPVEIPEKVRASAWSEKPSAVVAPTKKLDIAAAKTKLSFIT
ncbi:hypothetical protein COO91_04347 [Nostoc flagelliforme CCNUN1]|uniref:Uncharacterized protein n=1 Tax=Nostoc flagelliforme CCNUN1 TaxID=2038116 RepID=A0A2K8SSH1_9NOSO|nr:hypothetical protein COO91_04347 [Nostoc flagelliforme CCNUN1]